MIITVGCGANGAGKIGAAAASKMTATHTTSIATMTIMRHGARLKPQGIMVTGVILKRSSLSGGAVSLSLSGKKKAATTLATGAKAMMSGKRTATRRTTLGAEIQNGKKASVRTGGESTTGVKAMLRTGRDWPHQEKKGLDSTG